MIAAQFLYWSKSPPSGKLHTAPSMPKELCFCLPGSLPRIDGLEDLADCSLAAQQRFVNLVDVLYDQDRQVTVIGKRPLEQSLGGPLADLMRTRSRLGQLQVVGPQG